MKFTKDLLLRAINRFDEVGGFDMKCLDYEFNSTEEALDDFYDRLRSRDLEDIDKTFRKYILMSDEEFNNPFVKWTAKRAINIYDINHRPNTINIFKLF